MPRKELVLQNIKLGKLVHGGQCLATIEKSANVSGLKSDIADAGIIGRKVFVWGGLPGELVDVRVTKKKSSYLEGIVIAVHKASSDRIEPQEPLSYLSTSPWQIMSFEAENAAKQAILEETFTREGVENIVFEPFVAIASDTSGFHSASRDEKPYDYRNKMEMGFWGDDDGLHLAHYVRGTHGKQKVQGSMLAMDCINKAAQAVRDELNRLQVWGGDLKTVLLRANQEKTTVGALFIKKELDLSDFRLPKELQGLDIYYSEPKSPASVPTNKLYSFGDITLTDKVLGQNITYDVLSFFQVNLPVFEVAAEKIKGHVLNKACVDFYSGVGTIGIPVGASVLVDSDSSNIAMAKQNAPHQVEVVHAPSEEAVNYITKDKVLIVDPPRAGLHANVIERILAVLPPKIIYLSCNPSTQARDIGLLKEKYKITYAQGFNFFPRTPHIESLIVLERV